MSIEINYILKFNSILITDNFQFESSNKLLKNFGKTSKNVHVILLYDMYQYTMKSTQLN